MSAPRQLGMLLSDKAAVLTNPLFRLSWAAESMDFAELAGICSEVEHHDYSESGMSGASYSRQVGRRKPPTITLKRAMRAGGGSWVWAWHQLACHGRHGMHRDATLSVFAPADDLSGPASTNYTLIRAFPSKIEMSGCKAGGTEVVLQTVTIQCDDMLDET